MTSTFRQAMVARLTVVHVGGHDVVQRPVVAEMVVVFDPLPNRMLQSFGCRADVQQPVPAREVKRSSPPLRGRVMRRGLECPVPPTIVVRAGLVLA
ncbi:MAG: hypothetical protein KA401_03710 [Anaerolineae bacterium]|nr:hypothetical protein [Anaerolineae bacterium]